MILDRIKLIAAMAQKRVTSKEVCTRSHLSRATLTAVRSGKSCTESTAQAIANALGVPLADLLPDESEAKR